MAGSAPEAEGSVTISSAHETFRRSASTIAGGGSYDVATHATSVATGRPSYTVVFRGTGATVKGIVTSSSGKAAIYLDNRLVATVDWKRTTTTATNVWSSATLSDAPHTLRIDVLGTATGANSYVALDAVTIR